MSMTDEKAAVLLQKHCPFRVIDGEGVTYHGWVLSAMREAYQDGYNDGSGRSAISPASLEAVQRDAERYRWLRSIRATEWDRLGNYAVDALDAAIDTAIAAAPQKGEAS